ncbi:MAG TPA: amino acid ABC transporter substrate-binding protein [Anaerolineae bacterium]|nr:amino acid ABC transporter substrate-binding protein [Anaerolineae bacterium]
MKKQLIFVLSLLTVLLVACGGSGETVEVTRIVEVEVTRVVDGGGDGGGTTTAPAGGNTLDAVRDRDVLKCGISGSLVGFSAPDPDTNEFVGFDVDFCRAVAAAVLGDASKLEAVSTTGTSRFPTLQSGEVDMLSRNTTWTISRDTALGFEFMPVTFYDGQGMMVRAASDITTLEGLEGGTICVQAGTTTEKNLADVMNALGVNYEPKVFPDNATTTAAYDEGACDGFTTDKSGLLATKTTLSDPDAHVILEATMSKEPLAPLVRHGDNNWGDVVRWTINCTIQAEELGITSANVDDMLGGDDPVIQNLLGEAGDLGEPLGLSNDFCYQAIKQVGNYGEIFDRNLGPDTPFNLDRGVNAQWTDGGLLYAPPFR